MTQNTKSSSPIAAFHFRDYLSSPALLILTAAGISLRFLFLTRKPFWFDECFSVELARIDWRNFLRLLWWREANMSLYYMLLRIWLHFGQSEFFIRSLSVLIAAATVPVIYWLAGLLYDRRVALIASALFTFNAYHVRYAREARSYALLVLLATLSSGFLIISIRKPGRPSRGYVLASILAVYAHFYALLLLAAHWMTLRWIGAPDSHSDEPGPVRRPMRRVGIAIGVAVLPLLAFVAKTGAGPIKWISRPGLSDIFEFFEHLCGSDRWPLAAVYALAVVTALYPVRKLLLARNQSWETWRVQFLLVWLCFPIVLTVLLSFARPVFLGRYMIFCLPALVILVAAGLARIQQPVLLAAGLVGVLLLGLQGVFFVYDHDFDTERDASGAATNFILDHTEPGDAVVFYIPAGRVSYEFFRSLRAGENSASPNFTARLGPEILFPHNGAGLDYRDFTGKPNGDLLRTKAPAQQRVWVVLMNNGPPGNPDPTTLTLTQALSESFPRIRIWQLPRVELRLYSKQ
jgi:mannosyltransferase